MAVSSGTPEGIHRIGGGHLENLRLKPKEGKLAKPGISALKALTAGEAARQMREVFPRAKSLHEAAKTVGSTTEDLIRSVGFELIHVPSREFPNHYRIVHPDGAKGFTDANLAKLSGVFTTTSGH